MRRYSGMFRQCLLVMLLLVVAPVQAEYLLMARSPQSFPETMLALQTSIKEHGYVVSRVQRIDIGLTSSGFETDKYRIVFFGKPEEQRRIAAEYPHLIPYLPLKVTLFAEEDETVVVSTDYTRLPELATDEQLANLFMRWRNDMVSILQEIRQQ